MSWYRCRECDEVFGDKASAQRAARLEDGIEPWESVDICPCCHSDDLEELESCALCGGPVKDMGSEFCENCREMIDGAFEYAFDMVDPNGKDRLELIEIMFERAEETKFYGTN